jgi:arsenate reductase
MTDFPITIFHNPKCGTSRNVLAMIRGGRIRAGDGRVSEDVPGPASSGRVMAQGGVRPHEWLRVKGTPAEPWA